MTAPYILAKTLADAHRFAQDELGLTRGHYRIVTSPSTIKGIFGADLYLVPGWTQRHDRFTMKSALRWTRLNKIEVAPRDRPVMTDGLEPAGIQSSLFDATDFFTAPAPVEPEPEQEGPKRRRRRCSDCGLLVEPDEMDQHVSEHLQVGA